MTRVSPPELARELPGPQASTRVTRAPRRRRWGAVQPPNAPAPTTATCRCLLIGSQPFSKGDAPSAARATAQDSRNDRREMRLTPGRGAEYAPRGPRSARPAARTAEGAGPTDRHTH